MILDAAALAMIALLAAGGVSGAGWAAAAQLAPATSSTLTAPQTVHQAQVEARVLFAPQAVRASDGERHLAYELRVTSFYSGDDPLKLVRVAIFADEAPAPLATIEGAALYGLLTQPAILATVLRSPRGEPRRSSSG